VREVEVIAGRKRDAKEGFEEGVEDGRLGGVREGEVAIVSFKIFDLIFLEATRGTKVKVARVLIAEGAVFDLSSLSPVGSTLEVFLAEMSFCKGAKVMLQRGEVAVFLKSIEEGNDGAERPH
jgi:hypothetical protein